MKPVGQATTIAGGLDGDRHSRPGSDRQVLLVEAEVLDRLGLAPGTVREQVTVRGLSLEALADGQRLGIGSAGFEVAGPCAPCARMDEIRPGLRRVLEGQRGRFLRVTRTGTFGIGDPIVPEPNA
jgi:MOSC domain-containing protein YiiM